MTSLSFKYNNIFKARHFSLLAFTTRFFVVHKAVDRNKVTRTSGSKTIPCHHMSTQCSLSLSLVSSSGSSSPAILGRSSSSQI
ncbi:hypothetical protein DPEC_G00005530 [Dallia pectoralis]|uniref:Uncharacterized protein n=1 Tax=Dallia pectoralis TaxID=75939 RepID=A0ACC2HJZ0_DALPE|nr:hypothetical protein DPEC_G00005530 [Dallia pectoralis]